MRNVRGLKRYALYAALTLAPVGVEISRAQTSPFDSAHTYRLSKKITNIGAAPTYTRTYQALAADSEQLVFQQLANGKLFAAFVSQDPTVDDYGSNRANNSNAFRQVYWLDRYSDLPAVCISCSSAGTTGNAHSTNPKIGGPSGEEGRYVAYESDVTNLYSFPVGAGNDPHQIYVHDRKFEKNLLSTSKCDPENNSNVKQGGNGTSFLWQLSADGKNILMTSAATNEIDNLTPTCTDSNGAVRDVFVRNGSNCFQPGTGACYTSVLYDDYGYHAGESTVELLNNHSKNAQMSPDASVVVFDTSATNPVQYNPDTRPYSDIYYHKSDDFSLVSQTMIPFCADGVVQTLRNDNGPANGDSQRPSVDSTGRYVVFDSMADDMVVDEANPAMVCSGGNPHPNTFSYVASNGVSQIYLFDKLNQKIEMISLAYNATSGATRVGGNGDSTNARVSLDGRFVVFESRATNLKATTTTSQKNIFLYDRVRKVTDIVTAGTSGAGLDADADLNHVSGTGFTVSYHTRATDAVSETAAQGGVGPTCGGSRCQQVYLAQNACPTDTDGDLVPDCADLCPTDVNKTQGGQCGCGFADTDTDSDFTADCVETCDTDPLKTSPGQCGCGVADNDVDFDGIANCVDKCPTDPTKSTSAGACGCGVAETDTDSDGSQDCVDRCPTNPAKYAASSCACTDLKDQPGACGCNVADVDANGNGALDCLDPSASTQPSSPKVEVSKVLLGKGKSNFTARLMLQKFTGKVSYAVSLRRGATTETKTSTSPFVNFAKLRKGTYTLSYTVSVGTGAAKKTSKETSVQLKVG
jgi:hypothetical protein